MKALVTGGTSGIGRAIALELARRGHAVSVIGRQRDALAALAAGGVHAIEADLADRAGLARALEGLEPDILVNNAGLMPPIRHFCDTEMADIDAALSVNVASAIHLTRLVAPGMRERRRGHIFFTGSTAGHAPFANMAVYCATKAAIGGFAQALRLDMAPHGVRVTEIVAGRVETGLYRAILPEETRAAMYAGGLAVQPQDVAAMVAAVLDLPGNVDISRFDIVPTHQATATGSQTTQKESRA